MSACPERRSRLVVGCRREHAGGTLRGLRVTPQALVPALLVAALFRASPAGAEVITTHDRGLTLSVDTAHACPGGLLVVNLRAARPLGPSQALLFGRRVPFFQTPVGLRALVGIPATTVAGPARLGIEIHGRRGRRRLSAAFDVAPAPRAQRSLAIPAARIAAVTTPAALRDSRRLLATLRTTSEVAQWMGPLRPPVATAPAASFGVVEERAGGLSVNERLDGIYGEYHRGLDYPVPVGTVVQAPAAGTVLLAAFLSVSGHTLVIDHGQGLVSVLCHLSRIEVAQGQWVEGRTPVALSGDTGVLATPHLHWGTYLHGIAVDPAIISSATF